GRRAPADRAGHGEEPGDGCLHAMSENERVVPSDPLRKSVVKLFTVTRKPNHYEPWSHGYQHASGGSGCIIEGHRVLTNAHVVTNAVFIQALKNGDVKKYPARVEHVSHDEELAVLRVDDP